MGASASGKSVLLQALSGRIQDMSVGGKVWMDGKVVNPRNPNNPIALVPQGDSVIGDLTAREVTTQTALFKRNEPREQIDQDVNELLEKLGLSKVADGIIGTLIFVSSSSTSSFHHHHLPSHLISICSCFTERIKWWTKETCRNCE
jgi:ABC-type multidrug transport system ATPase subunit